MSKYSSFKDQQLITEGWRTFMVEQQPINSAPASTDKPTAEPQASSNQKTIIDAVNKTVENKMSSPFYKTIDNTTNEADKIFAIIQFLKNIKQPQNSTIFYKLLGQEIIKQLATGK